MFSAHDSFLSGILVNYYDCGNIDVGSTNSGCVSSQYVPSLTRTHLKQQFNLVQQENNIIQQRKQQNSRRINRIASNLLTGSYRLHLKLSIQDKHVSCSLITVATNSNASFLDRLLVDSVHYGTKSSSAKAATSSRLAVVSIEFDKPSFLAATQTVDCDNKANITDVAQNGFIYQGHNFQFLLSKDPHQKTAFFLMDDNSDRIFPDASSLRNFVADYTTQPTISRAGY